MQPCPARLCCSTPGSKHPRVAEALLATPWEMGGGSAPTPGLGGPVTALAPSGRWKKLMTGSGTATPGRKPVLSTCCPCTSTAGWSTVPLGPSGLTPRYGPQGAGVQRTPQHGSTRHLGGLLVADCTLGVGPASIPAWGALCCGGANWGGDGRGDGDRLCCSTPAAASEITQKYLQQVCVPCTAWHGGCSEASPDSHKPLPTLRGCSANTSCQAELGELAELGCPRGRGY